MILNLSELSEEPLHAQVSRQIRAKVLSGALAGGEPVPSIRRMAREQRISVITVQRAYEDLEREGLLQSRRGKGFWVAPIAEKERHRVAEQRFEEALGHLVMCATAEGLGETDIRHVLDVILEKGVDT